MQYKDLRVGNAYYTTNESNTWTITKLVPPNQFSIYQNLYLQDWQSHYVGWKLYKSKQVYPQRRKV